MNRLVPPRRKVLHFSVVARCELSSGRGVEEDVVERLLAPFVKLGVDRSVAERAGRLRRHLDIRTPDALIAATALQHGLTLVTRNARHYRPVPGLRIESPRSGAQH